MNEVNPSVLHRFHILQQRKQRKIWGQVAGVQRSNPTHLSEGVSVYGVGAGVVVLLDEVPVLLPLTLQGLLSAVDVSRKVALPSEGERRTTSL